MSMNHLDPRAMYSRSLIVEAFLFFLDKDEFENISVRSIVKKAGVNRSTFYHHFQDKYDLLRQVEDEVLEKLRAFYQISGTPADINADRDLKFLAETTQPLPTCQLLIEHIYEHRQLYKNRLNNSHFLNRVAELLQNPFHVLYRNEVIADFAAYGTVSLIHRWLDQGTVISLEEMALNLTSVALFLFR